MFEHYTGLVREIVRLARDEARATGSEFIGTEHVLLGILQQPGTFVAEILSSLSVDLSKVREALKKLAFQSADLAGIEGLPFSPRCRMALAAAEEFSAKWKEAQVLPEHVLLGLLYERGCLAAQVLSQLGVGIDDVGYKVAERKRKNPPPPPGGTG